jgi:hypothetical protein
MVLKRRVNCASGSIDYQGSIKGPSDLFGAPFSSGFPMASAFLVNQILFLGARRDMSSACYLPINHP